VLLLEDGRAARERYCGRDRAPERSGLSWLPTAGDMRPGGNDVRGSVVGEHSPPPVITSRRSRPPSEPGFVNR
jgi:hypothetical protein